jgi:hypothetical protein
MQTRTAGKENEADVEEKERQKQEPGAFDIPADTHD